MFKKSLVTIAALGAFAGSAFAGVTLYGAVDGGFQYSYSKANKADKKVSSFKLAQGIDATNSFGIKGEEKIADDLIVGFKLENGFNLANGAFGDKAQRLFDREAIMYAKTVAGTVAVGREGAITSGFGMFGQFGGKVAAYGNGRGDVVGLQGVVAKYDRHDFSLTYQSPEFAAVKLLAQYANEGGKNAKDENEAQLGHGFFDNKKNNLFYAFGATYSDDQLYVTALVDILDKHEGNTKNGVKVSLGGNAKFDGFQVFAAGQYFNHIALQKAIVAEKEFFGEKGELGDVKGFGLNAGVAVPVATGSLKGNVGYMHAKQEANKDLKINRVVLGAVYDYPLSKRTTIYSGVGATFEKYKGVAEGKSTKGRAFAANFGLAHNF